MVCTSMDPASDITRADLIMGVFRVHGQLKNTHVTKGGCRDV